MTAVNQAQHNTWNGDSGHRWAADADRRDAVLAPVADALLAATHIQSGESILDLGCGCGATTITAASQAEPGGTAHGIDLSEPMLTVARQRARDAGLTTITFTQADAQTHRLDGAAYDAVISRFGTMFFDDPDAAFTNIGRAVRHGGRLVIATWQPLGRNDWLTVPGTALLRYGTLPDSQPGAPGMFAQADPDLLRSTLTRDRLDRRRQPSHHRHPPPRRRPSRRHQLPRRQRRRSRRARHRPGCRQARRARSRHRRARPPHHQPRRPPRRSHLDHYRHRKDISPP